MAIRAMHAHLALQQDARLAIWCQDGNIRVPIFSTMLAAATPTSLRRWAGSGMASS